MKELLIYCLLAVVKCAFSINDQIGLSRSRYSAVEGRELKIGVVLQEGLFDQDQNATIVLRYADGSEVLEDFDLPNPGSVGDVVDVEIPIQDNDDLDHPDTSFATIFLVPGTADLEVDPDATEARADIVEDDVAAVFSIYPELFIKEYESKLKACLGLHIEGELLRPISVLVYTEDGTAKAIKDYKPFLEVLSFPTGSEYGSEYCFPISIVDDSFVENYEHFYIFFKIVDQNALFVPPGEEFIVVNIFDDDLVYVSFVEEEYTVNEDEENVRVCLELSELEEKTIAPLWIDIFTSDIIKKDAGSGGFGSGFGPGGFPKGFGSGFGPGGFGPPKGFGPGGFGPKGFGPKGFGPGGFGPGGFGPGGFGPKGFGPGGFGPGGFGPGGFGPKGFGPGGFGPGGFGPGGFAPKGFGPGGFGPGGFGPKGFGPGGFGPGGFGPKGFGPGGFGPGGFGFGPAGLGPPYKLGYKPYLGYKPGYYGYKPGYYKYKPYGYYYGSGSGSGSGMPDKQDDTIGAAKAGIDYVPVKSTITFPKGSVNGNRACADICILDDRAFEKTEVFLVHIYAFEKNIIIHKPFYVPIFIEDNEEPFIRFSEHNYTLGESENSTIQVCVELGLDYGYEPTETEIWINLTANSLNTSTEFDSELEFLSFDKDALAEDGVDFELEETSIFFPVDSKDGDMVCVQVSAIDDLAFEKEEFFSLHLATSEMNVDVRNPYALLQIIDDEMANVSFTMEVYSVEESAENVSVCLELGNIIELTQAEIWVDIQTESREGFSNSSFFGYDFSMALGNFNSTGIAEENIDYVPIMETVRFPNGTEDGAVMCVSIDIIEDEIYEKEQHFLVRVVDAERNVIVSKSYAVVVIEDNDIVFLRLAEHTYEVSEDEGNVEFCVELTGVVNTTEAGIWASTLQLDNTAISGSDYINIDIAVSFPPGSENGELDCENITIIDNEAYEKNEAFSIHFTGVLEDNVLLSSPIYGLVTILDNDVVFLSFSEESYMVKEADEIVNITIELTGEFESAIWIWVSTLNGSAVGGVDFDEIIDLQLTIAETENNTNTTVSIFINEDNAFEKDEFFQVCISSEKNVVIENPCVNVTIISEDVVTLSLSETTYLVSEAENATICVDVVSPSANIETPIWVFFTLIEDSAIEGEDFVDPDATLTIEVGADIGDQFCQNISIIDNLAFEKTENFSVSISSEENVEFDIQDAIVEIADDDIVFLGFSEESYMVEEADEIVNITIELTGEFESAIWIWLSTFNGSAVGGVDFDEIIDLQLTIAETENDTNTTVSIFINEDNAFEKDEFFQVCISSEKNVEIENPCVNVTIISEDVVTLSLSETTYLVSEAENVTICVDVVSPSANIETPIWVFLTLMENSAIEGEDFVDPDATLTIEVGADIGDQVCQNITIIDDLAVEKAENFSVSISSEENVEFDIQDAIVKILDDDSVGVVGLSKSVYSGLEGETVEICVEISLFSSPPICTAGQVLVEISAPLDLPILRAYQGIAGSQVSITIPDNAVDGDEFCEETVIPNDSAFNMNEFLMLEVALSSFSTFDVDTLRNTGGLYVVDDEVAYVSFAESSPVIVEEALGNATVCIVLTGVKGCTERAVVLSVTSEDGSAHSGTDFKEVGQIVSINAGSEDGSETCFTFDLIDDAFVEKNEYFTLHVKLEDRNVWIKGSPYLNLTICDDDVVNVGFVQDSYEVEEDAGFVMICMVITNLVNPITSDLWVDISTVELTDQATANADFTPLDQETLSFFIGADNGDMACVNITIEEDEKFEATEQFAVRVDVVEENIFLQEPTVITVTILDSNEVDIEFNALSYTFMEGSLTPQICGVLGGVDGILEAEIMFSIDSDDMDRTAEGGGVDYADITFTSQFVPGNSDGAMQCTAVNIIDDDEFEMPENFTVHLSSQDRVNTANPYAEVVIISDDGI